MSVLDKKKTPRKTQKTNNQRMLNIKMSTKGGPVFTFSLPGGRLAHLPSPRLMPQLLTPLFSLELALLEEEIPKHMRLT